MIDPKLIEELRNWPGDGQGLRERAATVLDLAWKREAELVAELGEARAVSEKRLKRVLALDMALSDGNAEVARLTAALSDEREACATTVEREKWPITFSESVSDDERRMVQFAIDSTVRYAASAIRARSRSTGEA